MKSFFIANLWRWSAGLPEIEIDYSRKPDVEELIETEWSLNFEKHMRTRLIMGAIRYGRMRAPGKPCYSRIESMIKRLRAYEQDRNKEHLVDVANLALLEFEEGNGEFSATDEHSMHVERKG